MGTGDVYVVGFCEALAERDFASEELDVESGALRGDVTSCGGLRDLGRSVHTSVVDENVEVAWAGLDLLESFLD